MKPDLVEYADLIVRAGRVPYKVKFGNDYEAFHTVDMESIIELDEHGRTTRKKVDDPTQGNCWSSWSKLFQREHVHLPVFDVDHTPDTLTTWGEPVEFDTFIGELFHAAGSAIRWVPSTTKGHFHVYVDHPYMWDEYYDMLKTMTKQGIVQQGYLEAADSRRATYVRMPGVLKPDLSSQPLGPLTVEQWERRCDCGRVSPWLDGGVMGKRHDGTVHLPDDHRWHTKECAVSKVTLDTSITQKMMEYMVYDLSFTQQNEPWHIIPMSVA